MAILQFKVHADYEKVVRLREEIAKLENQLKSFGRNTPLDEIKAVETRLAEAKSQFTALSTEAAKAGATIDSDFKAKIYSASQTVNDFTREIIDQKAVIRGHESDVKRLKEAYQKALKNDSSKASAIKEELDAAKHTTEESKKVLFDLTQQQAKAKLSVKELKDEYAAFKGETKKTTDSHEDLLASLKKMAGSVIGVAALKGLASQIVAVRGQFQDMETSIETLVGKDMTAKLMPQIKEMAKISPLTMTDIVGAEKMMLGFNIEADKTIDYLKALSDVSMGNSQKFNSLTLAFSQMSAAGKLMGQDLNQFINAGFNPLQTIAEKTGKSIAQLKEEMSKGAISAEMVQQAFIDATSAGGKFYNMSENASKTINGQISMMQDAMDAAFNEIGTKTEGIIINSIKAATSLIQNYEKIGKVLVGLVTTYGAYRTAVLISTAATSKHTIAEIALTNVRIAARKAQQALNAAMLTNPYVALAVAVGGLVTAYLALRDNTSAAERAQNELNNRKEEAIRKEKEHASAIQSLIDKAKDETAITAEREAAMLSLKKEYPKIFEQYDLEKLKLADIVELKQKIAQEDYDAAKRAAQGSMAATESRIRSMENNIDYKWLFKKELDAERELLKEQQKDYLMTYSLPEYLAKLKSLSLEELTKELGGAQFMASGTGVGVFDGQPTTKEFYDAMVKGIESEIESRKEGVKDYKEKYDKAEKEWKEAKALLDEIKKKKEDYSEQDYNKAVTEEQSKAAAFKKLGGDTTGKKEKDAGQSYNDQLAQQERINALLDKNERDRARTVKDNAFMVEQARIDAMEDGHAKTMAQMALDHQKELESLERQKQDYIAKVVEQEKAVFDAREDAKLKNNPKYKKQTFDSAEAEAKVDTSAYDKVIKSKKEQYIANEGELLKNLFSQYMSYTDQKEELERQYLEDVLALNLAYLQTGDEKYVRSIDVRTKAYIQSLNKLEQGMSIADYELIFSDPSKMTSATIEKALGVARKALSELDKDADPETYKILIDAIEKLENAKMERPFEAWETSALGLIKQLAKVNMMKEQIEKGEREKDDDEFKKAKADLAKGLVGTGVTAFGDALSKAADSMKQIAEVSGDIDLEKQAEALANAGNVLSSVASGAASGGWVGAILGGATSMMNIFTSALMDSEVAAAKAKKAYEDYIEEIARKARLINEEDYDTIFGVRTLEKVIDASEAAQKAMDAYQKAKEALDKDVELPLNPNGRPSSLQDESKSNHLKRLLSGIYDYEKRNGRNVATGINLEKATALLEAYKDTEEANADWYKDLEKAVKALKDYEENAKIVDNYLTSLFSNVGGEIADAIMQGNDALEVLEKNAGQIFKSIAKDMIMSVLIGPEFIEKYKKMLRDAMATSGAEDDAAVLEGFVDELSSNIEEASEKWEEIKRIAEEKGIDMFGDESESQQTASRKGYETLSEDTGNELVGRATAQYESNLRMEEATRGMKDSIDLMAANQVQIRDIAADARSLIASSYAELQQISANTGAIIKPIGAIRVAVEEMNQKIDKL